MNNSVEIKLDPALAAVLAKGVPASVLAAVCRVMDEQNLLTIGDASAKRLSFPKEGQTTPEGLRVITNRLRQSITNARARVVGTDVLSGIGSNVGYFGIHEFGFNGVVNVRAHSSRTPIRYRPATDSKTVSLKAARAGGLLTKAGKPRKGGGTLTESRTFVVKAHKRNVRMPARRMIARTVEERAPEYQSALNAGIGEALGGAA